MTFPRVLLRSETPTNLYRIVEYSNCFLPLMILVLSYVTDNKKSITRTLGVGAKNGKTRDGDG